MWFLIKSTVFICITLVVLSFFSTNEENDKALSASTVTNAVISAGEIVHYMSAICVERPEVCAKGAETISLLSERTRDGAKVAFKLLESQLSEKKDAAPQTASQQTPNTLTPAEADAIKTGTIVATIAASNTNEMRIPIPMARPAQF